MRDNDAGVGVKNNHTQHECIYTSVSDQKIQSLTELFMQTTKHMSVIFGILFLSLLSTRTATGQAQCDGTGIPTRAKYRLLTINMTEAQVAIVMGGTGAEISQTGLPGAVQKVVQYKGPTVNYVFQGLMIVMFSNGRLLSKSITGLCQTSDGRCISTVIATRAKYNLLTTNMTEAQVATVMGGVGIEDSQAGAGNVVSKVVSYTGATVNYVPSSISLTFSNGLLLMKTALSLC